MLKSKKFWAYDVSQSFDLKQDVLDSYKQKNRFYDDVFHFFEYMGSTPHPSLKPLFGRDPTEPTVISFVNVMVDINTLKILFAILPNTKVLTLKLCSNLFELSNLEFLINTLLNSNKPTNIFNFIFEWNSKIKHEGNTYSVTDMDKLFNIDNSTYINLLKCQQILCKVVTSNRLEAICLRGNFLGDSNANLIFDYLKQTLH